LSYIAAKFRCSRLIDAGWMFRRSLFIVHAALFIAATGKFPLLH